MCGMTLFPTLIRCCTFCTFDDGFNDSFTLSALLGGPAPRFCSSLLLLLPVLFPAIPAPPPPPAVLFLLVSAKQALIQALLRCLL